MEPKKLPVYRGQVDGFDTGVFAMSFVDYPATESAFVALAAQKDAVRLVHEARKHVLTGVVLIPEQLIYRCTPGMGEYYLTFTAEDIEAIAFKMVEDGVALTHTSHQHQTKLRGNHLTELWMVADPQRDKAAVLGLGELPAGTLVASYKIEDDEYWEREVMTGNVRGFSLEGIFNLIHSAEMKKNEKPAAALAKKGTAKTKKSNPVSAMFRTLAAMLEGETSEEAAEIEQVAATDETDSGTPYLIYELADGNEMWVDHEGYATIDGQNAPAGEHELADGNYIVIDDEGRMVETEPEGGGAAAEEPPAELSAQQRAEAIARGKAHLAAQSMERRVKALETQMAGMKQQPSTPPAVPPATGGGTSGAEMTRSERMAAIIKARQAMSK